ncbi:MAG TPA: peptidoglycan DD-metalloendopeptidase family protein [Anaerolineae bacterium]|nr:peptidoglycan DD-metalloendopeptidase family protein [Anaerolineae bacterium]
MINKIIRIIVVTATIFFTPMKTVSAQDNPTYPIYIVQPGETLTQIAYKFNVSLDDLIQINGIVNPNLISEGTQLYIPDLEGVSGILTTQTVGLGESLRSFLRQYQIPKELFMLLNRITSPQEIYAGSSLIIPMDESNKPLINTHNLQKYQTLFEQTVVLNENPWTVTYNNQINYSIDFLPGEPIFTTSEDEENEIISISPYIQSVDINPLPLVQGHTTLIKIKSYLPLIIKGHLGSRELHFFLSTEEENIYYALQGIHAMTKPGLIPLYLEGYFENGQSFALEQNLLLESGMYPKDPPLHVLDETVDPSITKQENDFVNLIIESITPEQNWSGNFRYPVDGSLEEGTIGFTSRFGNRRSYNNSEYIYFHTGVDFGVYVNSLNIYAAALGRVVFAGLLTVRGNATYIDHGQGIFSGYFHQNEIFVKEGDFVEAGQLIGLIGNTGRVTGPHLHWEVWANGVQVDPVDWVNNTYP